MKTATEEWDRALINARWKRGEVEGEVLGIGDILGKKIPQIGPEGLMKKIEVRGTFTSALLLGRGGGASHAERTAKATERTAKATEKIAEKGILAFEP